MQAFLENKIAIIEAGTGTGKSIAYLLPAMAMAAKKGEKIVISTGTINLQEQLLTKDIPSLLKALGIELKAVLVKGMSNYLCLRRLENIADDLPHMTAQEEKEIEHISSWSQTTNEGSKSSLPFVPQHSVWESVKAESDGCTRQKCPHFEECFFFKAREDASDAHLLIVNHHLLFADLALREENNDDDPAVLPSYKRVVIDEAHHIEDVATEFFAKHLSRIEILKVMGKLASERAGQQGGKLLSLRRKLLDHFGRHIDDKARALNRHLTDNLADQRRVVLESLRCCFDRLEEFLMVVKGAIQEKFRMRKEHYAFPLWVNEVSPAITDLAAALRHYVVSLNRLDGYFDSLDDPKLNGMSGSLRTEIKALAGRLDEQANILALFAEPIDEDHVVRWIEAKQLNTLVNIELYNVEMDISQHLVERLFKRFPTVAMCSATLANYDGFGFFRKRMGLLEDKFSGNAILENQYGSPFDYAKQAMLVIPTDMPQPQEAHFTSAVIEKIEKIVKVSRGGVFILFTSYSMLQECYNALEQSLSQLGFPLFKQGDSPRRQIIQQFKEQKRSVLFGTSSFWEGVDVAGDALRCVIIVKLPFQVPSDPIFEARSEKISRLGGNPFMELSIPNAIIKFKQGFGRLIRQRDDYGCIVCLDHRLLSRPYGKLFLDNLPACKQVFATTNVALQQMENFYRDWSVTESNR